MNLERIYSTVYTEQIKPDYYAQLDTALGLVKPGLKYEPILDSYVKKGKPYDAGEASITYLIHLF